MDYSYSKLNNMRDEIAEYLKSDQLLREAVEEVNRKDIIRGSLVARNARHDKVQVEKILEGELQKDLPVRDYIFIQNFREVVHMAKISLDMGSSLDKNLLLKAYRILAEDESAYYRKTNPVIYAFNHVPAYSLDIEEKLQDCFKRVYRKEAGNDVIIKGMYIHNKIIDIYPFENYSAELAIFAMNYLFIANGLLPISMPIGREWYLEMVSSNLKGHKQEEFYNFLYRAVFDKMQGTLKACEEYRNDMFKRE